MSNFSEILQYARSLDIIDTHEHLPPEQDWAAGKDDVLTEWLSHYFSCDLVSAGLSQRDLATVVRDSSKPIEKRWKLVEPFWDAARHTGYARALDIAARDLYGLARVDGDTIAELDKEFRKRREAAGRGQSHYEYVLKKKSRVAVSLVDALMETQRPADKKFFRPVYRIDPFLKLPDPVARENASREFGIRVHTLEDWKHALETGIERALAGGAVALKCAVAYERSLSFAKVAAARAEEAFNALAAIPSGPDAGTVYGAATLMEMSKTFGDHVMHHALEVADEKGLTVQVHTGLQEGNGNILENSHPALLTNLLLEYRNVTFDLFHMSYPYQNVLAALAKNFPNVMIDMCWAHIISPEASVRALVEFLDSVPANKISAFGGDYLFVDGVYGHQYLAREDVSRALAIKVEEGVFDIDRAKEICRWLFVDNPKRIFRLDI